MSAYETYRHRLLHKPQRQWDTDPIEILNKTYTDVVPMFSVVMPIHNQEAVIANVLTSVVTYTLGTYELILIIDGCTDSTRDRVTKWAEDTKFPTTLTKIWIFENPKGIFETSCDNQGFVVSRGKYIVEIQADMILLTLGYNIILATPMEIYDDILAISGRCCHQLNGFPGYNCGKVGDLVGKPHTILSDFANHNKVFITHTANRGPIVFRASMLEAMGFLDEAHYVLGDDDHDLFARAYCDRRWRVGFVPVEVYSPLEWGSTRKQMPNDVRTYLAYRKYNERNGFLNQNRSAIQFDPPQTRDLPASMRCSAVRALMNTNRS